jgi:hypothetical protein
MARQHYILPQGNIEDVFTVRLGAGNTSNDNLSSVDAGKIVKLVATDRYDLAVAGDAIEGFISSVELATTGGYSIGGITDETDIVYCLADGLQATPGTGTIAVGDYVVAGSITAKGTALTSYPKVCKATAAGNTLNFKWRVVSLGTANTGAVGTSIVIKKV